MEVFVDPRYYLFGNTDNLSQAGNTEFNVQDLASLFKVTNDTLNNIVTTNEDLLNIDLGV